MKLQLSADAQRDLDEIADYTAARWGEGQARRYIGELRAAAELLIDNPGLGRVRAGVPPPDRVYRVGSHFLVYHADGHTDRLVVLRILHVKMDIVTRVRDTLRSTR